MDSITRLLHNLTYRNVQILLLCLQKIIKQPDSFFTYPFKTFCQNLNPRATPPASHKPAQQSCSGCQSCYFSLFQHGLTPPLPEPCLTCAHTRAHTQVHTHRGTCVHTCRHTLFQEPHAAKVSLLRAFRFLSSCVLPSFCAEYLRT